MVKPPTYRDLLKAVIRAEEIILERNALEAKKKKTAGVFTPFSLYRTGGGSSFRGSGFQQGSFQGQGVSQSSSATKSVSGREFGRSGNKKDG